MFKKFLAVVLAFFAAAAFAAVDVNKASQADLETVKGIGPAISGKILEERKKGAFKDWPDLVDRVKGVGDGNAAKFSAEGLTVNGAGFAGAAPAAAKPAKAEPAAKPEKAEKAAKAAKAETPAPAPAADKKSDVKADAKAKAAEEKKAKADAKAAAKEEKKAQAAAKAASAAEAKGAKK